MDASQDVPPSGDDSTASSRSQRRRQQTTAANARAASARDPFRGKDHFTFSGVFAVTRASVSAGFDRAVIGHHVNRISAVNELVAGFDIGHVVV